MTKLQQYTYVCAPSPLQVAAVSALAIAMRQAVDAYRRQWGLPIHATVDAGFSRIAQISQQPVTFDYPRRGLPETFHYVGPLRFPGPEQVSFPWERLDGRPLIYASLGTLQNKTIDLFRCIAEACQGLPARWRRSATTRMLA